MIQPQFQSQLNTTINIGNKSSARRRTKYSIVYEYC